MPLEYKLDRSVELVTNTKYRNLYQWCITESWPIDESMERSRSEDFIPYPWSVFLFASDFGISTSARTISPAIGGPGEQKVSAQFEVEDTIKAVLETEQDGGPRIAFFGTGRNIEKVGLIIQRADGPEHEGAFTSGYVALSADLGIQTKQLDDSLDVTLRLSRERFDHVYDLVRRRHVNRLRLRISGVRGFYSVWSPDIETDLIKVLYSCGDQGLSVTSDQIGELPTLGEIDQADLTIWRDLASPDRSVGDDIPHEDAMLKSRQESLRVQGEHEWRLSSEQMRQFWYLGFERLEVWVDRLSVLIVVLIIIQLVVLLRSVLGSQ